ncbi:Bcr/CflA family efflux MFS transporter [Bradyrhizobium sediminis]|uniref:Bcr/CflA family efflux transporter n=1 Tax=Bradyrhizobium sediminis TaxID=2840469 RepID=A0A975NIN7_9BRAD|nr:Bcr/CflA family efflux MFS transporter [Bradyrhizobium sediminis]QWG15535.1 Bcr/CflA family efflux MFS transporter [Bradyrhizobium sediminis]
MANASVAAPNSAPKATLFLLAGLVALSEFAVTAYIPAITIIADGLGVRTEIVQTTVSVGLVTGAIAGLVIGAVADSMGRRQLLFPALGLYIVGSVCAASAPSISWLFIGRFFQAVGACAGIILSRAIARDLHSGPQLTRLLSGVTLVFSLAPAVAPLLGGLLAAWLGWRAIFAFAAIYGCAVFVGMLLLPETKKGPAAPIKVKAIFATYKNILTSKGFIIPNMVAAALMASMFAFLVSTAPIFVKGLQLSPALVGGFPAVAVSGTILGASLARWAATRIEPARIVRVGSLIALASSIAMALIPISAPYLLGAITFFCLGFGFALPVTVSMAMTRFGDKAGAASAMLGAIQSVGGTVGASMVPLIGGSIYHAVPAAMIAGSVVALALSLSLGTVATAQKRSCEPA